MTHLIVFVVGCGIEKQQLPIQQCNEGLKEITLSEYQLQALFWMLQREQGKYVKSDSSRASEYTNGSLWEIHYFEDHTPFYFCPLFRLAEIVNPETLYTMKGGIIADEMGLGKTITLLSLLLVSRNSISLLFISFR